MITNVTRYTKFNFSNHDLAFKVRGNMLNALVPFDVNHNGLFQQAQIQKALVSILNENPNEIKYVIGNVFRYDKDNDRAVTYDQFTNFSVQQHFGEMAIQRLHKKGSYSRGRQRVMNLEQFQITLNYSLQFINSQGTRQQYSRLFSEVDLDNDGWIKYEDYFLFLREYFGSQSFAANQNQPIMPPQPKPQPPVVQQYHSDIEFPEFRLARLIYTQFKVVVMEKDTNRSMSLDKTKVSLILNEIFKISSSQINELSSLFLANTPNGTLSYEKFMKMMIPFYYCEYDINRQVLGDKISESQFIQNVRNASYFVNVQPSPILLRELFKIANQNQSGYLNKMEYINTLGKIFQGYEFDTRGSGVVSR